jgi:hypothetical protein
MNRRDNGLHASSYVRLRDVETHVVEGLLDRLRDEDVAAYVAPASGRRGPYGDTVLPDSPSDSVFVDADRRDQARTIIEAYLAEVADELAWAALVAGFHTPSADEVPRWPASEDVDEPADATGPTGPTELSGPAGPSEVSGPAEASDPSDATESATGRDREPTGFVTMPWPPAAPTTAVPADDDHFEPPPPPPIPVPDTLGRFAWAAVLGGPLFLIVATLVGLEASGWSGLLALGAFMGGFVTLVARMKDRPPTDLGDDDGAVV